LRSAGKLRVTQPGGILPACGAVSQSGRHFIFFFGITGVASRVVGVFVVFFFGAWVVVVSVWCVYNRPAVLFASASTAAGRFFFFDCYSARQVVSRSRASDSSILPRQQRRDRLIAARAARPRLAAGSQRAGVELCFPCRAADNALLSLQHRSDARQAPGGEVATSFSTGRSR